MDHLLDNEFPIEDDGFNFKTTTTNITSPIQQVNYIPQMTCT